MAKANKAENIPSLSEVKSLALQKFRESSIFTQDKVTYAYTIQKAIRDSIEQLFGDKNLLAFTPLFRELEISPLEAGADFLPHNTGWPMALLTHLSRIIQEEIMIVEGNTSVEQQNKERVTNFPNPRDDSFYLFAFYQSVIRRFKSDEFYKLSNGGKEPNTLSDAVENEFFDQNLDPLTIIQLLQMGEFGTSPQDISWNFDPQKDQQWEDQHIQEALNALIAEIATTYPEISAESARRQSAYPEQTV